MKHCSEHIPTVVGAVVNTSLRKPYHGLCLLPVLAGLLLIQFAATARALESDSNAAERQRIIVVVGAGGDAAYAGEFADWAAGWQALAQHRNWNLTLLGAEPAKVEDSGADQATSREQLQAAIDDHVGCDARLWLVMLGHGTSAGSNAKFNLAGPDVSAEELAIWLGPLSCPVVVINCSSASAPFLPTLSKPGRIVITATRSASELNYSRFGKFLADSLQDSSADLDHDWEISLLEAFLTAVARTEQFYQDEMRLASEHALLDDNGDSRGTGGEFFRGLRPIQTAKEGEAVDGKSAARVTLFASPQAVQLSPAQLMERERIERHIDALREQKASMEEARYYEQLEAWLLELSAVYEAAES